MGEVKIKVINIKKDFTVGENIIPVLFGLDFEIMRGEFCLLIGPSGCGKSTLLHSIYGLEPPTQGKIIIDDKDIWSYSKDWRAHFRNKNVGFIPQQAFWIKSLSVIENIAIPAVIAGASFHESIPKAAKLIELVGMSKWANHRPYDLSGGQQQRIALARSLLLDPQLIIADEPTGNLDHKAGEELMELIQNINKQFSLTVVMVTHNPTQYRFGTRIINMEDGKIISNETQESEKIVEKKTDLPEEKTKSPEQKNEPLSKEAPVETK